ncbi:unnamed protein product [Rhizoctonia solani]|uniref:Uncharacterized protein n=1 Tax=Rhizoctonia solani TaxID=456999 RepID=A0A8H3CNP0_9AGAM|nr:unnamed protein product [Rhizoctonia solani]
MFRKRSDRKIKKDWPIAWLSHSILTTSLLQSWVYVLLFTAWATCVALICDKVRDLSFDSTLLGVFGTILGFIISFRTSSAFERYNEGKKLLSTIAYASRTFARIVATLAVWFHVPLEAKNTGPQVGRPEKEEQKVITAHATDGRPTSLSKPPLDIGKEKRTALELIEAFNIAVKHHLREISLKQDEPEQPGEKGILERPRVTSTHSSWASEATAREFPNPPGGVVIEIKPESTDEKDQPELDKATTGRPSPAQQSGGSGLSSRAVPISTQSARNLPLEISFCLTSYIVTLQQRETDASVTITDFSFGVLHIYISFFWQPFQLWDKLKYISVPGTSIAALMFLGLLSAGEEIENPFNDDRNDLDMDRFCDDLGQELKELTIPCVSARSDNGGLENRIESVLQCMRLKDSNPPKK